MDAVQRSAYTWRPEEARMNVKQGEGLRFYSKPDGKAAVIAARHELAPEVPDKDYDMWLFTGRVLERATRRQGGP